MNRTSQPLRGCCRNPSQMPRQRLIGLNGSARLVLWVLLVLVLPMANGCQPADQPAQKVGGILKNKTDDIGEFQAGGAAKEADLSLDTSRPLHAVTAGAAKNILGRMAQLSIKQAVDLFNAEHGRYPRDHAEFMERIIKPNQIQLPELPGNLAYQYDVENHELKIVEVDPEIP